MEMGPALDFDISSLLLLYSPKQEPALVFNIPTLPFFLVTLNKEPALDSHIYLTVLPVTVTIRDSLGLPHLLHFATTPSHPEQ